MAHYAYIDHYNIVTSIIVGKDESDPPGNWEEYYGALRTSYNTRGGVYYDPETGLPAADQSKAFRKNFAGVGYKYDKEKDAFIPPKPYSSWILNETSCTWEPPIPYPTDGNSYYWDEHDLSWAKIEL
jgi:hypothetical protein